MAKKGKNKNGRNKAKHSKLMGQKKNRIAKEKEKNRDRLNLLKEKIKDINASKKQTS